MNFYTHEPQQRYLVTLTIRRPCVWYVEGLEKLDLTLAPEMFPECKQGQVLLAHGPVLSVLDPKERMLVNWA